MAEIIALCTHCNSFHVMQSNNATGGKQQYRWVNVG